MAGEPESKEEALLARLLDEYELHRSPALASLVARADAALGLKPVELSPTKQVACGELDAMFRATGTSRRGPLVGALRLLAKETIGATLAPLLGGLATLPPDPRIAAFCFDALTQPQGVRELSIVLAKAAMETLGVHGHPEQGKALATLLERFSGAEEWPHDPDAPAWLYNVRPCARRAVALLIDLDPRPSASLLAEAEAQLGRAPAPGAPGGDWRLEDLMAAVARAPDDDGARLVLADLLTERGDPRGEFIALQVKRARGEGGRAVAAREKALLSTHRLEFLGPLRDAVHLSGLTFTRGFVSACSLKHPLRECPELALLESVDFERSTAFDPPPSLKNLVELCGLEYQSVPVMLAANPRARRVAVEGDEGDWSWPAPAHELDEARVRVSAIVGTRLVETTPARRMEVTSLAHIPPVGSLLKAAHPRVEALELRGFSHTRREPSQSIRAVREGSWVSLEVLLAPWEWEEPVLVGLFRFAEGLPPLRELVVRLPRRVELLLRPRVEAHPALNRARIEIV